MLLSQIASNYVIFERRSGFVPRYSNDINVEIAA